MDESGWILALTVTDDHSPDPSQVPGLLAQVNQEIDRFVGDGIYDQEPVYTAVAEHSAIAIIPPRKGVVLSTAIADCPSQRDCHVGDIVSKGRSHWKRASGYYLQSRAENVFFRYQTILGGRLRARTHEAQEREAAIGRAVLNRMCQLGRPQSHPVR